MACTTCLVCFISTNNGRSKKEEVKKPIKTGARSGHITNHKQSGTFDIYGYTRGTPILCPGNTKGGCITVPLTSCSTCLD